MTGLTFGFMEDGASAFGSSLRNLPELVIKILHGPFFYEITVCRRIRQKAGRGIFRRLKLRRVGFPHIFWNLRESRFFDQSQKIGHALTETPAFRLGEAAEVSLSILGRPLSSRLPQNKKVVHRLLIKGGGFKQAHCFFYEIGGRAMIRKEATSPEIQSVIMLRVPLAYLGQ